MPELSVVGPTVVVLVELGAEEEVVDSPLVVRDISDRELIVSTCTAPENWTIDPRLAGAPVAQNTVCTAPTVTAAGSPIRPHGPRSPGGHDRYSRGGDLRAAPRSVIQL